MVTHVGKGHFLGRQPPPYPMGAGPSVPNFSRFLYIFAYTHDVERLNLAYNMRRGRACFRGQPRHRILHKCVARFVSDSRVSCCNLITLCLACRLQCIVSSEEWKRYLKLLTDSSYPKTVIDTELAYSCQIIHKGWMADSKRSPTAYIYIIGETHHKITVVYRVCSICKILLGVRFPQHSLLTFI